MDILLLLTYGAIAFAIFKVFKVPVNGFTIATGVLGGIVLVAALLLSMNYNHPYTRVARFYFHTTPIVPTVGGKVVEVDVAEAQRVQAGDVLFRIDPTPYQAQVDQKQAQLAAAKQRSSELSVNVVTFEEAYNSAVDQQEAAEDIHDRNKELLPKGAVAEGEYIQSRQNHLSATARVSQAKAELERAKLEAESAINGVHTEVAEAQAALAGAEFELEQTTLKAPTDGAVLQVMLRPGMMAVPLPLKPVMVFQHDEARFFVASFLQNSAQRIREGAEVEAIFPAAPGWTFQGRVKLVGAAVAQGQLQPSGDMIDASSIQEDGRINVLIEFEDDTFEGFHIPPGSSGQVAVYSDHLRGLAVLRRVLMRMKSWTNYVFTDGHGVP